MKNNNSYQKRIVLYEKIHLIDEKDFEALVSIVNPRKGQLILDACCGYGAVSERLLKTIRKNKLDTEIILSDNSELQLSRAKENLKGKKLNFVLADSRKTPFPNNHFDTVVSKMGLHEVNKAGQKKMLKEFYRIIKPGGKIVIWELALDKKTQPLFAKIIRKKDSLAGFSSFLRNRYFPRKEEIISLLKKTGFNNAKVEHDVFPILSIRNRKEEFVSADRLKILEKKKSLDQSDIKLLEKIAEEKINKLRTFIKEKLSEKEKKLMHYSEKRNDTIMKATKAIFKATKPE